MSTPGRRPHQPLPDDPQWYRDAVIYQLHVKTFFDSNNDGMGDFAGLVEKLDYVQSLGVTAIWLMPFYPSPLRDDGYDIADYTDVHHSYGTLRDVRRLIRECHKRGLRVITELVINHTSDQHPWFQRARHARPGSAWRDFYVWSDDDQRYSGTRIIFLDVERSNWTWDETAGAYYWHRFYSHQPDLNYDNPRVVEAMLRVLRFWMRMGVDGMRLDAVPYLIEREGTNNENLPETHEVLKRIRAEIDANFANRMLLAEANQWPEDVLPYFGDGDECHMAFHFPLMPRIYMAVAREDRHPITDIMRQTPDIPEGCQWAIFLRNHDELTLEMVTERERDYLWDFYAHDRRMRINLGIRRRLAPLMGNDRRKIELLNALLLSMRGTPIVYYGDELGMGDNVFLGDRDGVRTPMQWSPDRNGGFSRADPSQLYLPAIMDPEYGYGAVNVEAQERSSASLLNWMRRMIAVRQGSRVFGRGTLRFLYPRNRKVLAYLREHEDEVVLCVFNLSRAPQAVQLDLSEFIGRVPVELSGGSLFPPIGELYYLLTLPTYGFYWFALSSDAAHGATDAQDSPEWDTLVLPHGLPDLMKSRARATLQRDVLPQFLARRRWFAGKGGELERAVLTATLPIDEDTLACLVEAQMRGEDAPQVYFLPLARVDADALQGGSSQPQPAAVLALMRQGARVYELVDATTLDSFAHQMLAAMQQGMQQAFDDGQLIHSGSALLRDMDCTPDAAVEHARVEQSNSSVRVGGDIMLKYYRRLERGPHPELQMQRFLTDAGFAHVPAWLGSLVHEDAHGVQTALAIATRYVGNQGDGWQQTVDHLARHLEEPAEGMQAGAAADEASDPYITLIGKLGQRTAQLHAVLARSTGDAAFDPEPVSAADRKRWHDAAVARVSDALDQLQAALEHLPDDLQADAQALLARRDACMARVSQLAQHALAGVKTRIHGDYHLGQVLLAQDDWVIVDFEGEPARPLAERCQKQSPLRDVAGMLRSLDYARAAALRQLSRSVPGGGDNAVQRARAWADAAQRAFLGAYRAGLPAGTASARQGDANAAWLQLFVLQKACYELVYEAQHRPNWLDIPVRGVLDLLESEHAP